MDAWLNLSLQEVVLRLVLSIIASGLIGFDREVKNRPAGLRTHVLVGVASCLLALIQEDIATETTKLAMAYVGEQPFPVSSDRSRLIAQIVSGIGFLGAGTIIVTKQTVSGLTTAASLWATAALGIAFGMGFYSAAFLTTGIIMITLVVLKFIVRTPERIALEIHFDANHLTDAQIADLFNTHNTKHRLTRYSIEQGDGAANAVYTYHVTLAKGLSDAALMESLRQITAIRQVKGYDL